jgi:hypothetical protein
MAGRRSTAQQETTTPAIIPSTSLVASAVRYSGKAARVYRPSTEWQKEAYRHYGICGEARFAAQFFANSLSRAVLFPAEERDGKMVRLDTGPAYDNLRRIFGPDTSAQMLAAIGLHLSIGGECYVVGREHRVPDFDTDTESVGEVWEVVSALEMRVTGDEWSIDYGNGRPPVILTDDDVVIRIWRQHPERRIEADSPFRSLLPVLNEIEWLTRHIFAQTQSRLAGAGILFLPQGMTFPAPVDQNGEAVTTANEADGFMQVLADVMVSTNGDPSNPASLVPIVVTAPDEAIDKARLMHFWSELDGKALEMRAAAVHRFALGMDLPPEQVEGMSSNPGSGGGTSTGVSHWGAWQVDESTIKLHIEPTLELVVAAITVGFLRPATDGDEVVRYDTTSLRIRPDRSKQALEMWDRGLLSAAVVVRETGFEPEDMMDDEERKTWLLVKIASGSATPEQVQAALGQLGVNLGPLALPEAPTRESRPTPSLEDHEERAEPETPAAASLLLAACEPLVLRGLERAGNRLRTACKGSAPSVPSYATHTVVEAKNPDYLLEDAWTTAALVLDGVTQYAAEEVVPTLDAYCRMLLATQTPHTRERLARWMGPR